MKTAKRNNRNPKATAIKHDGPGRPKFIPAFPRSNEWTFTDFMEANDINTKADSKDFGKGPKCTMLTLRKFMKRDMWVGKGKTLRRNPRSLIVQLDGVTSEPNSKTGLGRRANLYSLRAKLAKKGTKASAPAPQVTQLPDVNVEVPLGTGNDGLSQSVQDYEARKAALLAPSAPAPVVPEVTELAPANVVPEAVTIPAVTITPEAAPVSSETNAVPSQDASQAAPVAEVAPTATIAA